MDPVIKKKLDTVAEAMKAPGADVQKMAQEMLDLANEDKAKKASDEQARNEAEVIKKQSTLKHLEAQLKGERTSLEEAEQNSMKRKEEMEEDKQRAKDDSSARAAGSMLTQKSVARKAEQRLTDAREDLAHSKEKRHKDQSQLQDYVEQRTAKQKEVTQMNMVGDSAAAARLQSDLNVLSRLEKGQRDNVANDDKEVKTMMDNLAVAEEDSRNNARQNTVESQKVLEKLNAAKAAAEGSVGKAMEDENKQAQVITAKL
eukprot:g2060.t1